MSAGVGDEGCLAIAAALDKNDTLTSLVLASNGISNVGLAALAKVMETNTSVLRLHVRDADLYDVCALEFARVLERNQSLADLSLEECRMGLVGISALAHALELNTGLTSLDLSDNDVCPQGFRALTRALEKNGTLTSLALNYALQDESVLDLAAMLARSDCSLIYLRCHGVEESGHMDSLAKALEDNYRLVQLWPADNEVRWILERNQGRALTFSQWVRRGDVDGVRQYLDAGIALDDGLESEMGLDAAIASNSLDVLELLLHSRLVRPMLFGYDFFERSRGVATLAAYLHTRPRHEGIMARLAQLVRGNAPCSRLVGAVNCRHAVKTLYGVLRKRFCLRWSSSYTQALRIPRDMANLLAQTLWHTRHDLQWVDQDNAEVLQRKGARSCRQPTIPEMFANKRRK